MPFRVLVAGGRVWVDYAQFRDLLDSLLSKRLPDVVIVTPGGRGVPALAASYAAARGLEVVPVLPDYQKHPGDAVDRQREELVAMADAAVIVAPDVDYYARRLLDAARKKSIPVQVVAAVRSRKQETKQEQPPPRLRGLPD